MASSMTKYPTANCTMNSALRTSCCHHFSGPTTVVILPPSTKPRPMTAAVKPFPLLPLEALLPDSSPVGWAAAAAAEGWWDEVLLTRRK